ncbi:MAG: hypothetical protein IJ180_07205 [Bacteroidales bacterium]|nr:hypothetical protein [Bacteroidales bacterium]
MAKKKETEVPFPMDVEDAILKDKDIFKAMRLYNDKYECGLRLSKEAIDKWLKENDIQVEIVW